MTDSERYIKWLDKSFQVAHQQTLMQMQTLGCAYRDIGIITAEEFMAWFDELKAIISKLRAIQ